MNLPKGYTYSKGLNADASRIQEVVFTVLKEYGLPVDPNATDADLNEPENFYRDGFFGVVKNPEGIIVGTFGLLEHEPGVVEIRKMYLLSEYRGKGIGKFMMNFLFTKAKEMGYSKVMLETASELKEAILMYEKYGFVLDEEAPATCRCDRVYHKKI